MNIFASVNPKLCNTKEYDEKTKIVFHALLPVHRNEYGNGYRV